MYNLGKHFEFRYDEIMPNSECIFVGQKYRLTVLSDRLIRFEYNENGFFINEPSKLVMNRKFNQPKFIVKQDDNYIEISTSYFNLKYTKDKEPKKNLEIKLTDSDKGWHFGHVEAKNYPVSTILEIDQTNKVKSLYSLDGFASIDDSNTDLFCKEGTITPRSERSGLDIYVFMYNKDFELAIKDYFKLTGFPALIPRYALGNWWSRNYEYNDITLRETINEFLKNKIPLSIILLDKDWHKRARVGKEHLKTGFTFNDDFFKSPAEMIQFSHSQGIRIGLNVNPTEGFYNIERYYEQAKSFLEADKNGVIPFNIMDNKTIDVYLKLFIHPLDNLGIDFFWLDYYDKKDLDKLFRLKHYQFNDMTKNYARRPMVLGYDSTIASHRYPVLYAGKTTVGWESLKQIPLFNANAANLGVSWWSHDIGGYFRGIEYDELYIRSIQLAVFSPILKFGVDKGKYYKKEPWRWNTKTRTIAIDYLKLRHRLIPYIYSEAYKYSKYGELFIKPLYYKVPEMYDDLIFCNEYYFGSQFFIAPIINKKDVVMDRVVHKFYLPEGIWYDFFTGKKFPGNRTYVSFYKDSTYPAFVKAGSIIPLGINEVVNDTTPPKDMEIHFFPGISNEYLLYEDDGLSDLHKKGFYLTTKIEYNYLPNNYTVIIRSIEGKSGIVPERRNYKLVFRNVKKAKEVIVYDNKEKTVVKAYVDGPNFIVEVNNIGTMGQLTVNCKGDDIEIEALRLINDDVEEIINDLQIETEMKEKIDAILFGDLSISKKRIEIRKLGMVKKGLDKKFIRMFLNLLTYIGQV